MEWLDQNFWGIVVGVFIGTFVGFKIGERIHVSMFKDILTRLQIPESRMLAMLEELRDDLPDDHEDAMPRVKVKVELVNDQLYVYRLDTMEFLCQGANREAVIACLADRFHKDFKIILSEEHGAKYLKENPTS